MTAPPRLAIFGLGKRYAVPVLQEVDLEVAPGEVHALLGANGAGKSTLSKIVAGLTPASTGRMELDGHPHAPASKAAAERAGVQIVQQELNLIPTLTVAENLFFGRLPSWGGWVRRGELRRRAEAALRRFGLEDVDPDRRCGELGVGTRQLIEIAAAVDRPCRLLILDEPTAALTAAESEVLFAQLQRLRSAGVSMIYISHRLDEVRSLADRITVLRDGRRVASGAVGEFSTERLVQLMVGEGQTSHAAEFTSYATDEAVLRVEALTRPPLVRGVSFTLHKGERLGIAGLIGSGRTECLRAIFGADIATGGGVSIGDDPRLRRFRSPQQAVAQGLAMVTEDRKRDGLLLTRPVRENASLASFARRYGLPAAARHWAIYRGGAERRDAERLRGELDIRCHSIDQPAGTLSGGNQQKVAVAKWLLGNPRVVMFDEPTRGIDVPARRRIYAVMKDLAAAGVGVLIVSSDLEELLENCDRIAVMSAGRIAETFVRGEWSHEAITAAAFKGYRGGAIEAGGGAA